MMSRIYMPSTVPASILKVQQIYEAELERIEKIQALEDEGRAEWQEIGLQPANYDCLSSPHQYAADQSLTAVIEAAAEALQNHGHKPAINRRLVREAVMGDLGEYRREHKSDDDSKGYWMRFNAIKAWDYLQTQFTPEIVKKQAMRAAAMDLRLVLRIQKNCHFTIDRHVAYIEVTMRSNPLKYDHSKRLYVGGGFPDATFESLEHFLTETNQPQVHQEMLREMFSTLYDISRECRKFKSRETQNFPGGGTLSFFNKKMRISLPISIAQDLVMFISEYLWNE